MDSISRLNQNLYVNRENDAPNRSARIKIDTSQDNKATEQQVNIIKNGSDKTMADADAMFARAQEYSDLSYKTQKGLQAYQSVEHSIKRESVSSMMGVNLYA